jgi:hypothetical protein
LLKHRSNESRVGNESAPGFSEREFAWKIVLQKVFGPRTTVTRNISTLLKVRPPNTRAIARRRMSTRPRNTMAWNTTQRNTSLPNTTARILASANTAQRITAQGTKAGQNTIPPPAIIRTRLPRTITPMTRPPIITS